MLTDLTSHKDGSDPYMSNLVINPILATKL